MLAQNKLLNEAKGTINKLFAYSNPARDINSCAEVAGSAAIIITNNDGKVILTKTINNKGKINVGNLANGTYFLHNKVSGETHKIAVKR